MTLVRLLSLSLPPRPPPPPPRRSSTHDESLTPSKRQRTITSNPHEEIPHSPSTSPQQAKDADARSADNGDYDDDDIETTKQRSATAVAAAAGDVFVTTFSLAHSILKIQALSYHTLFELIDAVCTYSVIGNDETAISHLWNVRIPIASSSAAASLVSDRLHYLTFASFDDGTAGVRQAADTTLGMLHLHLTEPGTKLILEYDYGCPKYYEITVVGAKRFDERGDGSDSDDFPRCQPIPVPRHYRLYKVPCDLLRHANLDDEFPALSSWITASTPSHHLEWSMFRSHRNHHGVLRLGLGRHGPMIFAPLAATVKDVGGYLHMFNHACGFLLPEQQPRHARDADADDEDLDQHPMLVIPQEYVDAAALTNQPMATQAASYEHCRLEQSIDEGIDVDLCLVPAQNQNVTTLSYQWNAAFPNLAALAGYAQGSSNGRIPKGWIVYKEGIIRICTGPSTKLASSTMASARHCYSSSELFLRDADLNEPKQLPLATMELANIDSLMHFFCVVEGMLSTLIVPRNN